MFELQKILKAYHIANEAHFNQKRLSGEPFINHPINVAYILAETGFDSDTVCAALLHDVVEDTDTTFEDLEDMGYPKEVIDALRLLTHEKYVPYMDYVSKIKDNPLAKTVKLADLRHNSDMTRLDVVDDKAMKRAEKYRKAIQLLEE